MFIDLIFKKKGLNGLEINLNLPRNYKYTCFLYVVFSNFKNMPLKFAPLLKSYIQKKLLVFWFYKLCYNEYEL